MPFALFRNIFLFVLVHRGIMLSKLEIIQYRIERMHVSINQSCTGNPKCFAETLGISRSMLYLYLQELKAQGAPIVYRRKQNSYYYTSPWQPKK